MGLRFDLTAPRCCPARRRVRGAARSARGPSERGSRPRYHDTAIPMSEMRTKCPNIGYYAYLRRETSSMSNPGTRSRRACFEALHARTRRSSQSRGPAPERWWALALSGAPERDAPVTSNAGLSLLTAQCGLDDGLTAAGERPGEPVASSLTRPSAQLESEVRHLVTPSGARRYSAIGLDGWSRTRSHGLQVDQYPAAVRDWISPPCGSRCRREVDLP